jgi:hypothetical protein
MVALVAMVMIHSAAVGVAARVPHLLLLPIILVGRDRVVEDRLQVWPVPVGILHPLHSPSTKYPNYIIIGLYHASTRPMNYTIHYQHLMDRSPKAKPKSGYFERHHIVPKCMGGTNKKSNLVYLTAEEHYVAHQLLVKMYPSNKKLAHAAHFMGITRGNKSYGWLRRKHSKAASLSITGTKRSKETKRKMAISKIGNKHGEGCKGKPFSETHISNLKIAQREAQNRPDVIAKRQAKINLIPPATCPNCGKTGHYSAMARWHFNNCKELFL